MEEKEIEPIIEKFVYCLRCAQRRQEQLLLGQTNAAGEIAKLLDEELGVRGLAKDGFVQVQFSCGHPTACIVSDDEGTNYCGWCESEGTHAARITQLQAQLAEMREALDAVTDENELRLFVFECSEYPGEPVMNVFEGHFPEVKKTLSAAPVEVLCSIDGEIYLDYVNERTSVRLRHCGI